MSITALRIFIAVCFFLLAAIGVPAQLASGINVFILRDVELHAPQAVQKVSPHAKSETRSIRQGVNAKSARHGAIAVVRFIRIRAAVVEACRGPVLFSCISQQARVGHACGRPKHPCTQVQPPYGVFAHGLVAFRCK